MMFLYLDFPEWELGRLFMGGILGIGILMNEISRHSSFLSSLCHDGMIRIQDQGQCLVKCHVKTGHTVLKIIRSVIFLTIVSWHGVKSVSISSYKMRHSIGLESGFRWVINEQSSCYVARISFALDWTHPYIIQGKED